MATKTTAPIKAKNLLFTNTELESTVKHTAKIFYEGKQPLLRKELNEKARINNNDKIRGDMANKERPIKQKQVNLTDKSGQEEIIKIDEEQIKYIISAEPELQEECFKSLTSISESKMEKLGNSRILTRTKSTFSDRIPLRFCEIHETPESQLSSWSSITGDNSLSDLYCDDEFKLSLEFDPNMQLFTTIEEEVEQEQEIAFPHLLKVPEGKT